MPKTCILTDSTVQFPVPVFAGRSLVHMLPLHLEINDQRYEKSEGVKAAEFPRTLDNGFVHKVFAPSEEEYISMITSLAARYDEIVVITHAHDLSETYANAEKAVETLQGHTKIELVDSGTTSIGLGLVVQKASAAAEEGRSAAEIKDLIRALLPRVYSVFCIEGLTYLHARGYFQKSQAWVAEYLKMLPLFVLDNGNLTPTQKARNLRHLVDLMHEFLFEFEHLEHIAILQGVPPFENESKALRERINLDFEGTPISEHTISAQLAAMIGPRSLGMFVIQSEES